MRSELIFKAAVHESNRYRLCRLVAKGSRKLHRPNTRLQETINDTLEFFSVPVSRVEGASFAQPKQDRRVAYKEDVVYMPLKETTMSMPSVSDVLASKEQRPVTSFSPQHP
jgi:hypothetical protein